jgi:glycerate 2-kinase
MVRRSLRGSLASQALARASAVDLIAAGKAAAEMLDAFRSERPGLARRSVGIVPYGVRPPEPGLEWHVGRHPVPDERSEAAGRAALRVAEAAGEDDLVILLLSGGASSLMALPANGISSGDKRASLHRLLGAGTDIESLNGVRKHISRLKGGRLAAACRGRFLTLAVSDVVGDDLSVIGSGPGVGDPSTFHGAAEVLSRHGGLDSYPRAVVDHVMRGVAGEMAESPKPGDPSLGRAVAAVIGNRADAVAAAGRAATALGYVVHVLEEPVVGEARDAAKEYADRVGRLVGHDPAPLCVLSAGETTVRVVGDGRGGRNQEFALALARTIGAVDRPTALVSVGTDGVDGPTDAAGGYVDTTTLSRARDQGLGDPERFLADNNSYEFFLRLGDLVKTGPTATNVGDVQILLTARKS